MNEKINYVVARPLDENNRDDKTIVIYFANSDEVMNDTFEDAKKVVDTASKQVGKQYYIYELVRRDS